MNKINLTEKEIEQVFGNRRSNDHNGFHALWFYPTVFVVIFIFSYVLINFPAVSHVLTFWYQTEIVPNSSPDITYSPDIISIQSGSQVEDIQNKLPEISDNHIFIPKISANAPISWQVNNDENEIQSKLQTGVVNLVDTALPGHTGNVFVTGHSSNYFWAKGNYKTVFSLLNRLAVGDLIYIKYQNKLYIYKTTGAKTVSPSDTSVLSQGNDSKLTLMTCTPVGTSLKRLILSASQIDPNPDTNVINPNTSTNQSLPSGVR